MTQPSPHDFRIADRLVGPNHPPLIIAEVSANHLGSIDRALETIDAAAACGADAIKIQSYTADTITLDHDGPGFTIQGGLWDGRSLYELYQEVHTPFEWHPALFERAARHGVPLFSTPFDHTAVDLLESLDAPAYKIASFEITDLPLIARVAPGRTKPCPHAVTSLEFPCQAEILQPIEPCHIRVETLLFPTHHVDYVL